MAEAVVSEASSVFLRKSRRMPCAPAVVRLAIRRCVTWMMVSSCGECEIPCDSVAHLSIATYDRLPEGHSDGYDQLIRVRANPVATFCFPV